MNEPVPHAHGPPPVILSMDVQPSPSGTSLEARVRQLEDEIVALRNTKALEERIVDKVTERLQRATGADRFTAAAPRRPGTTGEVLASIENMSPTRGGFAWLFVDMFVDGRLMCLMLWDKRYTMAWTTHLVVWLFIPAIITSRWWFPASYIPFIGGFADKILDLLLAFGVYKALSREVKRYRNTLDVRG